MPTLLYRLFKPNLIGESGQQAKSRFAIKEQQLLFLIMLASSILIAACIDEGHNWGGDFSLYIAQTKALVNGSLSELYAANKFSMDNSIEILGPYLYPCGFPLLLAPVYLLFGMNFMVMKGFCGLFFILSLPLIYQLFKAHFPNKFFVFFIIIFIAFNAIYITFADAVLSDLPFFFFSVLSIYLMGRGNTLFNQALLGICIFFSYFIRDVGIVLLPTLFVFQVQMALFRRSEVKNWAFWAIPYLVFAIGFLLNFYLLPRGGQNHITIFLSNLTPGKIFTNTIVYLKQTDSFFINGIVPDNLLFIKLAPIPILVAIGMLARWREYSYLTAYLALTFSILVVWPFLTLRFLFPLVPFFLFFMMQGLLFVSEKVKLKQQYLVWGLSLYLVVFAAVNGIEAVRYSKEDTNAIYTPEMSRIYGYIQEHIPQGQVIGFNKPRVLRLITGVNSIGIDENSFEASPAQYLIIEKGQYSGRTNRYDKIFETSNYLILEKPQ